MKYYLGAVVLSLLLLAGLAAVFDRLPTIEEKEVGFTAVVGWSATGGSAKTLQAISSQLEFAMELPIYAQYEPGGGSLPALKAVIKKPRNAKVWNVGAFQTIETFHAQKKWSYGKYTFGPRKLKSGLEDYTLFSVWRDVPVLCVSPNSPYKIIAQLTKAMLGSNRVYKVATSGPGSAGDTAMKAYAKANGLKEGVHFEFVTYDSGSEAALAVTGGLSGEVAPDIVAQNMSEESDLISYGNLRPLMAFSSTPMKFTTVESGEIIIQPFHYMFEGKPLEFGVTFGISIPTPLASLVGAPLNAAATVLYRMTLKWPLLNIDIRASELGVIPFLRVGRGVLDTVNQEIAAVKWANTLP